MGRVGNCPPRFWQMRRRRQAAVARCITTCPPRFRKLLTTLNLKLKAKHCLKPHCRNGVVGHFGDNVVQDHTCLEEIFGLTSKPHNKIYVILILGRNLCSVHLWPGHTSRGIPSTSDEPEPEFSSSSRAELWRFRAEPSRAGALQFPSWNRADSNDNMYVKK